LHDLIQRLLAPYRHLVLWGHEHLDRLLAAYQHSLQTGGYPFLIFLMALESSVVPIPSEVIIPPAVILVLAGNTTMTLTGIVLAATLGSWIGASLMYAASRAAGRPLVVRFGRYVMITPGKVEQAERWSARFGSFGIFLSRMLPVVRHLIGIPAGIVRMNFLKYSLYTVLGSLLWCTVLAVISRLAGQDERLMRGDIKEVTLWLAATALVLGGVYYFFVHRMSRRAP
jgi:membrane protein DedA with SNARE-associated domain